MHKLCDYYTTETLRDATDVEARASLNAGRTDGGAGLISIDGRSCYVEIDCRLMPNADDHAPEAP